MSYSADSLETIKKGDYYQFHIVDKCFLQEGHVQNSKWGNFHYSILNIAANSIVKISSPEILQEMK